MHIVSRADAKSRGESLYFTGKPCSRGHTAPRYVSHGTCVECHQSHNRERYKENPEKAKKTALEWAQNNPEKVKEKARKWAKENPDREAARTAKYRASKLNATPTWLSPAYLAEIEGIYQFSQIMSLIGGRPYEVDHIEPLQGKTVCGLHVPWNLQVLERSENRQKSNSIPEEIETWR